MLSHIQADDRRFGLLASQIGKKVALTARRSFYQTSSVYDVICRTVALAAHEDITVPQALTCLKEDTHMGHYAASRLGHSAFLHGNVPVLALCLERSHRISAGLEEFADSRLELALLRCYLAILTRRSPDLDELVHLWHNTRPEFRNRYFHTICSLLDWEDIEASDELRSLMYA